MYLSNVHNVFEKILFLSYTIFQHCISIQVVLQDFASILHYCDFFFSLFGLST